MLVSFACALLALLSTCLMSYLALGVEITFWVAPIFSLVVVVLLLPFFKKGKFDEWPFFLIASGSVGGIVGMSVAFSWPTLYFLHKKIFLEWMQSTLFFATMISALVIAAGTFALAIVYVSKTYFFNDQNMKFPTVRLVDSMLQYDARSFRSKMMGKGILASLVWSAVGLLFRLRGFLLLQIHTIPTLLGIGFVAGHMVTKPLFIGMVLRILLLFGVKEWNLKPIVLEDLILTFSLGMLFALILLSLFSFLKYIKSFVRNEVENIAFSEIIKTLRNDFFSLVLILCAFIFCSVVLAYWNITILQQLYIGGAVTIASLIVASIFGQMGVLDLSSFGSFIVVPIGYLFPISSESKLIAFMFCTLVMGLLITILFSWKLANLAKISFKHLFGYQFLGFFISAISIGFIVWWYMERLRLGQSPLFSAQSLLQERFITLSGYDHSIFLLGFLAAMVIHFFVKDVSIVIVGCMMQIPTVAWLVLAGIIAYFINDCQRYYPFCFGLYASHAIWLFIQAFWG
ncbi:hypothetical protein HYV11_02975 [Candidatus Dependentiae bacterium]|nr:hypothetical protein [Candidatus Dependentiae bacterium]